MRGHMWSIRSVTQKWTGCEHLGGHSRLRTSAAGVTPTKRIEMTRAKRLLLALSLAGLAVVGPGCGGGNEQVQDTPRGSRGDERIREQCEAGSGRDVDETDVNNDGTP